jgi:hypothetical protein
MGAGRVPGVLPAGAASRLQGYRERLAGSLEDRRLGSSSIIIRKSAIRKLTAVPESGESKEVLEVVL